MVHVDRMPASGARALLLVAMLVILVAAGFLLLILWVGLLGGADNSDTSKREFALLAFAAAVGFAAAVVAIYGLAIRSPRVTQVAALAQGSAAGFLLVMWTSLTDGDDPVIAGFLGVIAIDVLMVYAARPT